MDARASRPWAAILTPRALARHLRAVRRHVTTAARSWRSDCAEVRRLAEERGALQLVATLVARGASPPVIFNAAASALGSLIKADYTSINRCEADRTMSVISYWRAPGVPDVTLPVGGRWTPGHDTASAAALRSHKPTRRASATVSSEIGGWQRDHRIGHTVACPLIIDDRLWGTISALYLGPDPPPDHLEERMGEFVELLNCAIIQAETQAELIASRARLVTSADATRRRIERDLHDGAQQHLISLILKVREAEARVTPEQHGLRRQLSDTADALSDILAELQEISRGLHPPVLARAGLRAALRALVRRSPVPVELDVDTDRRLPEELEIGLYYIVSEALTNILKHAHASMVRVGLDQEDSQVRLTVRDDGVGGADPARGTGLIGLKDRVEALGGTIQVTSPAGKGTTLLVTIPWPRPDESPEP
jgi:signal transduction histidine kinase